MTELTVNMKVITPHNKRTGKIVRETIQDNGTIYFGVKMDTSSELFELLWFYDYELEPAKKQKKK